MSEFTPEIDWDMILNTVMLGNGTAWFRDPGEPEENDVTAPEVAQHFGFENTEFSVLSGYSKYFAHVKESDGRKFPHWSTKESYVKRKNLSQSRLASRVERCFEELGLKINRIGVNSNDEELASIWLNEYRYPFIQWGEILENKEGVEFLNWNTDIFLNSKKLSEQPSDSWALKIPALVEAMMYLAEAPLKQSMLTMSRSASSAFSGVSPDKIPHPAIKFNENGHALVVATNTDGYLTEERFSCPTVITASYDVSEKLDDNELLVVMETLVNAFVSLSTQTMTAFDSAYHTEETGLMNLWEATGMTTWTKFPDGNEGHLVGPKGTFIAACYNWQNLTKAI